MAIGRNVQAMAGTHLDPGRPALLSIGDDVVFSLGVVVLTHDASSIIHLGYTRLAPVSIGSRVFFGAGSVVLPGVMIGDDVIVGAGSVITKDVPSGSVVAGNPARLIKSLTSFVEDRQRELSISPSFAPDELESGVATVNYRPSTRLAKILEHGVGYVGLPRDTLDRSEFEMLMDDEVDPG